MRRLATIALLTFALAFVSCGGGGSSGEVATRASSTGSVSTTATGPTNVPLQDNTWTQEADESNLLLAQISLNSPQNCPAHAGLPETPRTLAVQLEVDGNPIHQEHVRNGGMPPLVSPPAGPPPGGKQFSFDFQASLLRPGSDTDRTLTAKVIEVVGVQGCTPATWTVTSLKVDVIDFH
jgi:hypothetical protein